MAISKHEGLTSVSSLCEVEYEVCNRDAEEEKGSWSPDVQKGTKIPWSPDKDEMLQALVGKKEKGSKIPWSPDEDEMLRALVEKEEKGSKIPWSPDEDEILRALLEKKEKGSKIPWTPNEDLMLRSLVERHGAHSWSIICKEISGRPAKSCRLRWFNHLLPGLKFTPFTPEEDSMIIELHRIYGSRWAMIARHMSGRSDNAIKNRWNCTLKNRPPMPTKRKRYECFGWENIKGAEESCERDSELWKAPQEQNLLSPHFWHHREKETCERDSELWKAPEETCERDGELWKTPHELNLLSAVFWHRDKDTQQDLTGFEIDHGIDDPITSLTLGFPDLGIAAVRINRMQE